MAWPAAAVADSVRDFSIIFCRTTIAVQPNDSIKRLGEISVAVTWRDSAKHLAGELQWIIYTYWNIHQNMTRTLISPKDGAHIGNAQFFASKISRWENVPKPLNSQKLELTLSCTSDHLITLQVIQHGNGNGNSPFWMPNLHFWMFNLRLENMEA